MSRTIFSTFTKSIAAASFLLCTQLASAADLSGEWSLSVQIMGQAAGNTVILQQDGDQLSGEYNGRLGGEGDIEGSVAGDEISFSVVADPTVLSYTGTLQEDGTITGSVDFGGTKGTFVGTKRDAG